MSQPIALSDDELTAIMDAARPLAPCDRDRFLRAVAQAIVDLPERGPGSVYRAIHATFRMHFDPPDLRISESRSRAYP
jgi:hypothetical protein